jgi:hypothetical protein
MTDLTVDYATLDDSEQSLHRIGQEFEGATDRRDVLRGAWGSGRVADAMGDFVDNWDRHRKKLLESIKSVGEMCAGTKETFQGTDKQLADELANPD